MRHLNSYFSSYIFQDYFKIFFNYFFFLPFIFLFDYSTLKIQFLFYLHYLQNSNFQKLPKGRFPLFINKFFPNLNFIENMHPTNYCYQTKKSDFD
jgi:hypothetical protein